MNLCRTTGADDTRRLAGAIAELARAGDLVLLVGDLGTGKTAFAQGFAKALGVDEQVTSPTFTLVRTYRGRLPLNHLDVYRLDRLQEADDIGLAELIDDGGVTLIEWGDAVRPALQPDYREVRLAYAAVEGAPDDDGDDHRHLQFTVVGPSWAPRAEALAAALEAWSC